MNGKLTTRTASRGWIAALALLCVCAFPLAAPAAVRHERPQDANPPAPIERRPPGSSAALPATQPIGSYPGAPPQSAAPVQRLEPHGEHLAQWMNQHRNLTPEQQQEALGHEPGFSSLPAQVQQRYRQRLAQLNAMNPQRRERVLERNEWMEHLAPDQRAEVRGALGQLGSLPQDRRLVVAQTFRRLRDLPPEQRLDAVNSGRYGPALDAAQRAVLLNLLRVEPMLPPPDHPATQAPAQTPLQTPTAQPPQ